MNKLTFVVAIDRYDYGSGGNNIMHILAQYLSNLGEKVFTFGTGKPNSNYNVLEIENYDSSKSTLNDINENSKIITNLDPETTVFICWNTFDTRWLRKYGKVARWSIYYDYNLDYNDHDLIFFQQEGYNIRNQNFDGLMNIFDIDQEFWQPSNVAKSQNTFLYRKAQWNVENLNEHAKRHLTHVYNLNQKPFFNIDNLAGVGIPVLKDEEMLKKELRDIYQKTDYFVCFDDITSHSIFASLCGAKTIVIPGYLKCTKEEYKEQFDFFKYGIAYGLDDTKHMLLTKSKLRPHMKLLRDNSIRDVENFVKVCYEKFTI